MSPTDIVLLYVFPVIGNILVFLLFLSSLIDVKKVVKSNTMGKLNSIPFAVQLTQCMMWTIYGVVTSNLFLVPVNFIGGIFALYFILSVIPIMDPSERDRFALITSFSLLLPFTLALFYYFTLTSDALTKAIAISCVIFNCSFFLAPLSGLREIIKTKNSTQISIPLASTMIITSIFWLVYALAIADYFLMTPQAVGCFLSSIQLIVKFIYRDSNENDKENDNSNNKASGELNEKSLNHSNGFPSSDEKEKKTVELMVNSNGSAGINDNDVNRYNHESPDGPGSLEMELLNPNKRKPTKSTGLPISIDDEKEKEKQNEKIKGFSQEEETKKESEGNGLDPVAIVIALDNERPKSNKIIDDRDCESNFVTITS